MALSERYGCGRYGLMFVVLLMGSFWQIYVLLTKLSANNVGSSSVNQNMSEKLFVKIHESKRAPFFLKNAKKVLPVKGLDYGAALQNVASRNYSAVLLMFVDRAFLDMAINFHLACIQPFNIENYLFMATDNSTCGILLGLGINCLVYTTDNGTNEASRYGSKNFLRKMNIRTDMILDALNLGFSVLHSDADIYCYQNPFNFSRCPKAVCRRIILAPAGG